jgi:hypothetical protein
MNALLTWTGYQNSLTKNSPLSFRLRSGMGFAHDVYGEGGYPNEQPGPRSIFYRFVGGLISTNAIKLGKGSTPYSLTAQYDRQRQWYSLPHHVDTGSGRVALSRDLPRQHVNYYFAYDVHTVGDYWGERQLAAYPAAADVVVSPFGTYSGQSAFRGFAVSHGLSTSLVYTPTPYVGLNLLLSRFYDTPAPVPGLYGQPPVQFTGDLRVRLSKQILVDFNRSYYFNFANERWTPQFGIQISP